MHRFVGIVLVVVSAAAFGTLAIFGWYAYADGMDVLTVMFLRFSLSAVVMTILLVTRREPLPRGLTLLKLVGMGAIGYVGQAFSYLTALKYASPGLVALLLYLYPVFVAILSTIWLRESITRFKTVALGLALVGTALTVGPEGGQVLGVLLAISAAAIYSVYIIVGTQVLRRVSAIQSSTVILAAAGATSGVLMIGNGPHLPATGAGWMTIVSMALIATVLPVVTFLAGLERIGPTNAAMLSTLEPVVTVLLAAMLLGETLRSITLLGGGLILVAVLLLAQSELRRTKPVLVGE
ncbi:MAG: DMT family transporter [Anaerolineales bacterium]|nr:MAG: DMT family transporter [Anaerolineales bacterium]